MDLFSRMTEAAPILEFPYTGNYNALSPYYNHYPQQHSSSLDHLLHQNYSTLGRDAVVYQVPEYVPLETVLRQLGVDVNSLHQTGYDRNHFTTAPLPMYFPRPYRTGRRRRLVCYETSDSEDDDYKHHHRHRRHSHHDSLQQGQQGSIRLHNLLNNPRTSPQSGEGNLPSSNSMPNLNSMWQNMRGPSSPEGTAVTHVWQAMQNAAQSAPSNPNAPSQPSSFLSNMFNQMRQSPGAVIQPPPSGPSQPPYAQPNQEAANNFLAARNAPPGINQPPPPPQPYPQPNRVAVSNFFAARDAPPGINQPPPPPPPQPNQSAVSNFFAARNAPPMNNQPNQAVSNVWNRVEGAVQNAPPPMPPAPPPPSASMTAWNQMRPYQAPMVPPLNQRPPFPSPFGVPPRGPPASSAPASFGALLSQAHRQRSAYAGAM